MAATSELTALHRTIEELTNAMSSVRTRYGDVPAVKRLLGDVERILLDVADLDDLTPPPPASVTELQPIDDTPLDPSLWADADDEGLGGYHGGRR
jgi:hypothetical protein